MSDLDLLIDELAPPARGRRPKEISAEKVRDLTAEDIKSLGKLKDGDLAQQARPIQKIRSTHHALAKLLAEGRPNEEISKITGYDPCYISTISNHDPAFKNLIEYYRGQVADAFVSVHERLAQLSMLSAEELQDRLDQNPDEFTRRELMDLLSLSADRTGFGPQSRNLQVNLNVDLAPRLAKARQRSGLESGGVPPVLPDGPEVRSPPELLDLRPNKDK